MYEHHCWDAVQLGLGEVAEVALPLLLQSGKELTGGTADLRTEGASSKEM